MENIEEVETVEESAEGPEATEEVETSEEAPAEAPDFTADIAELREMINSLRDIITSGFSAVSALMVENGAVVRTIVEEEEEPEDFTRLEDLDFDI